jgi:cytochrome d ubiquinol oxidase subunit II
MPLDHRERRPSEIGGVFGVASILTPFFLAATIGGVASGRIPPGNHAGDSITSWFNPMSMLFAFAGVVSAAFIAAVFLTMAAGLVVLCADARPLLSRGVLRGTRLTAIAAVTSLVLTWGFAQRPYLLPTTLTIQDGAGDPNTLRWLLIVTMVAVLLVGPALALLYRLDLTDRLAADHDDDLVEAPTHPPS